MYLIPVSRRFINEGHYKKWISIGNASWSVPQNHDYHLHTTVNTKVKNWSICKLSRLFLLALNYKAFWEGFVRLRCSVERWFNVVWILASSLGKSFRSTKLLIYSQNVFGVLKFSCFAINALTQCITEKKYKIIFDIIAHFNRNKVTIWRCPIYTDFL